MIRMHSAASSHATPKDPSLHAACALSVPCTRSACAPVCVQAVYVIGQQPSMSWMISWTVMFWLENATVRRFDSRFPSPSSWSHCRLDIITTDAYLTPWHIFSGTIREIARGLPLVCNKKILKARPTGTEDEQAVTRSVSIWCQAHSVGI